MLWVRISIRVRCTPYNIMWYKVCLWFSYGYSGFLHQLNWPPQCSWDIVESGVKHPNSLFLSNLQTLVFEVFENGMRLCISGFFSCGPISICMATVICWIDWYNQCPCYLLYLWVQFSLMMRCIWYKILWYLNNCIWLVVFS